MPTRLQPVFEINAERSMLKVHSKDQDTYKARVVGGRVSEDLFARGLCPPSGTQLTEKELDRITRLIRKQHR